MKLNGSVALVTGASSGIGEGFARELHGRGTNVILVARREDRLKLIEEELNSRRSGSAAVLAIDLATHAGIEVVASYIRSNRVDLLINNAGRGSFGCFEEFPIADEQSMVTLNVKATLALSHAVIPQLKERKSGGIIGISSIAAFQPLAYMATYAATKAFNFSHTMALRYELQEYGIHVLAVCPGPVETEFAGVARIPGKMTGLPRDSVDTVVKQSLRALERNQPFIVPGLRGWALSLLSRNLPLSLSTWITARTLKSTLDAVRKD